MSRKNNKRRQVERAVMSPQAVGLSAEPSLSLRRSVAEMVQRLAPHDVALAKAHLQRRANVITLGTCCSGTDVCSFAVNEVMLALGGAMEHEFSCEMHETKQRFIRRFHAPKKMFQDVTTLAHMSLDVISMSQRVVPSVDVVIAGFSCKDVSILNKHSARNKGCVLEGSLRTGGTFEGVRHYCEISRPGIVILENVTALLNSGSSGMSGADAVVQSMNALGYAVLVLQLQPLVHGVPHRRERVFFLCMRVSGAALSGTQVQSFSKLMDDIKAIVMNDLSLPLVPLTDVLLSDEDPALADWSFSPQSDTPSLACFRQRYPSNRSSASVNKALGVHNRCATLVGL